MYLLSLPQCFSGNFITDLLDNTQRSNISRVKWLRFKSGAFHKLCDFG